MADVAWQIPLQAGRPTVPLTTPEQMTNMQQMQMRMQALRQETQQQNALRNLFAQPGAIDPNSGLPTQNALKQMWRIDPATALDINKGLVQTEGLRAQQSYRQSEAAGKLNDDIKKAYIDAGGVYEESLKTMPPDRAAQRATEQLNQGLAPLRKSGALSPGQQIPSQFDPTVYAGLKYTPEQRVTNERGRYSEPEEVEFGGKKYTAIYDKDDRVYKSLGPGNTVIMDPDKVRKIGAGNPPRELRPSQEIAVLDKDGNVVGRMAARESTTEAGKWVRSDNNKPIDIPDGGRIDVGQAANAVMLGGREGALLQRQLGAGLQAVKAVRDIVALPSGASSGIFAGRGQESGLLNAAKETLTNSVTSQEVQAYNALMPGLSRSLAFIDSQGLAPGQKFTESFNAEMLKEGDTVQTKMLKLARQREIVEAGMETLLTNPRLAAEQKTAAKKVMEDMKAAVPWTPSDVIQLMTSKNPADTLRNMTGRDTVPIPSKGGQQGAGSMSAPSEASQGSAPPESAFKGKRYLTNPETGEVWELRDGKAVKAR